MKRLSDLTNELLAQREHAEPPGALAGRALMTKAFSHSPTGADAETAMHDASRGAWFDQRVVDFVSKSPVAAVDSSDLGVGGAAGVARDFLAVSGAALLRLPGAVVLEPNEPFLVRSDVFIGGSEVAEGQPIPMAIGTYTRTTLTPRKFVSDLEIFTNESLRSIGAATAFATSLAGGAGRALDFAFLDTGTGGGLDTQTAVSSTGSTEAQIRADLRSMLAAAANQGQDLQRSVWVMSPHTAGYISTLLTAGNVPAHPDIGASGGLLLNLPVVISAGASTPPGESPFAATIALLDPASTIRSTAAAEFRSSRNATIQMDSAPSSHDSTTPTMTSSLVSMFQVNSTAMYSIIHCGFYQRPNSAVTLTVAF